MRFVFVIATLFTINFIHLLVLRKWEMSEKVDKGIMMWYGRLSYRRKFIRTIMDNSNRYSYHVWVLL